MTHGILTLSQALRHHAKPAETSVRLSDGLRCLYSNTLELLTATTSMTSMALLAILLLLAGLVLLTVEVFIPSGGLLALCTAATLIGSLACAWLAWGKTHPPLFWLFFTALIILVPTTLVALFKILPHTAAGKRMLLEAPDAERVEPFAEETRRLQTLIGRAGEAATLLNPGGIVLVEGRRLHATAEGLLIEKGTPIQIIGVDGVHVIVSTSSAESTASSSSATVTPASAAELEEGPAGTERLPLDFDEL